MKRRPLVLGGTVSIAAPRPVFPQPNRKVWRVGFIAQDGARSNFDALVRELLRLGFEEHRDMVFDFKNARGQLNLLSGLATELAATKVDLIVAARNLEVQAAKRATTTIPIVMMLGVAPVETGLIATLARPGGNVTGTTTRTPALAGKQIEILRDTVPGLKRIAILFASFYPGVALYAREAERVCSALGVSSVLVPVHSPDRLDIAMRVINSSGSDAILVAVEEAIAINEIWRVIVFAAQHRLPTAYSITSSVQAGGLISYSPKLSALAKRNAWMIQRILDGAKVADIPVEEPAEFEMAINLRTARALGITINKSLLVRADELIQ